MTRVATGGTTTSVPPSLTNVCSLSPRWRELAGDLQPDSRR